MFLISSSFFLLFQEYSEVDKSPVPNEVEFLCQLFLCGAGYPNSNFKAEAGIVNYYPPGTTLSPHTDYSEPNKEAPLLSFRFKDDIFYILIFFFLFFCLCYNTFCNFLLLFYDCLCPSTFSKLLTLLSYSTLCYKERFHGYQR